MQKGHGSKIGRKMAAAVAALFTTKNHTEAARAAGISLSTLKRWLRLPEFQAEFLQVGRDAMSQTNARIQHSSAAWASLGLKLAGDAATPASVKARLVLGFLDRGNKAVEQEDILVRLAAMERSLAEKNHRK